MRIGVDLGGTKIEALALDQDGRELQRHRVPTPREDYNGTIAAIVALVERLEREASARGTVGVGIPGTLRANGLVKNANSTWLNGHPLAQDLSHALSREVRVSNDANCLAVSEATDGASANAHLVFAVILGTGCGGGIAIDARLHAGPNGLAGEWGHNPLPWPAEAEYPGPPCYCGRRGCLEQWCSGPAVARDLLQVSGVPATAAEIAQSSDPACVAAIDRFLDRLARGLIGMVHVLDPDVLVLGGGLSQIARIYAELPARMRAYSFGGEFDTPIRPAQYGDSSGVRGAAWLWPAQG